VEVADGREHWWRRRDHGDGGLVAGVEVEPVVDGPLGGCDEVGGGDELGAAGDNDGAVPERWVGVRVEAEFGEAEVDLGGGEEALLSRTEAEEEDPIQDVLPYPGVWRDKVADADGVADDLDAARRGRSGKSCGSHGDEGRDK